jgi:hypothetical protein
MLTPTDDADEPALPDEARARQAEALAAPTLPTDRRGGVLHVRFKGRESDRLLEAMRTFRELIRQRPGDTPVLLHVELWGSAALPMSLKPVAYDGDLLAEVRRRLGDGVVELRLT